MRFLALAALMVTLQGCAAIPVTAWVALGSAAAGAGITAFHDCRQDGGCRAIPLPP
jgi:uncharacterized protein YceK